MLPIKKIVCLFALVLSNLAGAVCTQPVTKLDTRYISNNNEVTDKVTGLIWQRCIVGKTWDGSACSGSATTVNWEDALNYAKLNSANGWRLPNIKELASLADYGCAPAINTVQFPLIMSGDDVVWSSSIDVSINSDPTIDNNKQAWSFSFHYGNSSSDPKSSLHAIRLVRD